MLSNQSRTAFANSEKGKTLRSHLKEMVKNPNYNTRVYSLSVDQSEDLFVEKHMNYMCSFPKLDHLQYISNLKLMTKVAIVGKKLS